MFRISVVQLKALLKAAWEMVDNENTCLLGDRLNLLRDGCLHCCNDERVALVDGVLENLQRKF